MEESTMPAPEVVGRRGAEILAAIEGSAEYERLEASAKKYADCWATYTGYTIIAKWNLEKDCGPLFVEGIRVLALKAAIFEITGGDEHAAELVISAPVDEMTHAILAQYTLCQKMTAHLGVNFVHMTDQEAFGYNPGGYAHQCYVAAGWGEPNPRYWIGSAETGRRLKIVNERLGRIEIGRFGRSHDITFDTRELVSAN